ncbi:MAG TPA: hypothetical protein VHM00_05580 [Caldimonas sp.]|jgi:hypothetical protein|nr:hypothetical protein [Caldimonas sp.]HEX2540535.1 hypothetical protein [Caldimonas sp.]
MFARSLSLLSAAWRPSKQKAATRVESTPPGAARAVGTGNDWRAWFGRRRRVAALAAARDAFAEALFDVRTAEAARVLDRIDVARSLHELWHLREEVFSLVSRRHDQAEATTRLAALDRGFPRRVHAGPAARNG